MAGVVGLGRIGAQWDLSDPLRKKPATHTGGWLSVPEVEKVVVTDVDQERMKQVVAGFANEKLYASLATDDGCDVVSVATPAQTHYAVVAELLRSKSPPRLIFCEKPLAPDLGDAIKIVEECKAYGVKLAVNHTRRWDPVWRFVAEQARSDIKDTPNMAVAHFTGDVLNVGVHMADLINWYGLGSCCETFTHRDAEYLLFEMDILFPRRRIRIIDNGHTVEVYTAEPSSQYAGIKELLRLHPEDSRLDPTGDRRPAPTPMEEACKQLARVLDTGEEPYCTGEDGLAALKRALEWEKRAA